jgi:hypothetical protein
VEQLVEVLQLAMKQLKEILIAVNVVTDLTGKIMRTFVSFEFDSSQESLLGNPPGQELAQYLCEGLKSAGLHVIGPKNREDWAWDFVFDKGCYQIESIVGHVDYRPIQWLITTYLHLKFWKKLFPGKLFKANAESTLQRYCQEIHSLLSDSRFSSVRWYDQKEFDQNLTDRWGSSP